MNKKAPLKSGLEYDVIIFKKMYCFTKNNPSIVRFAKRGLRRRLRREGKQIIREEITLLAA